MKPFIIPAVLACSLPAAAQQVRPECPTGILFEFQAPVRASFIPDSASIVHPSSKGRTLVQFTVDTSGNILPGTFHAIRSYSQAEVDRIKAASTLWHFTPAKSAGRPVCQMFQTLVDSSITAPNKP